MALLGFSKLSNDFTEVSVGMVNVRLFINDTL
jgi:hypothetical protein